jgi:hypothetical protein
MANPVQLNAGVDAARKFAFRLIEQEAPSLIQASAKGYVTDALLLQAVEVIVNAVEATK